MSSCCFSTSPQRSLQKSDMQILQVCGPEGSQCIVPYPSPTDSGLIQASALCYVYSLKASCIGNCGLHALAAIQIIVEQASVLLLCTKVYPIVHAPDAPALFAAACPEPGDSQHRPRQCHPRVLCPHPMLHAAKWRAGKLSVCLTDCKWTFIADFSMLWVTSWQILWLRYFASESSKHHHM